MARPSARSEFAPRLVVAERRVEDPRLLDVRADLHAGDRDEPDAGIVHFAGEQLAELASNLIRDPVWT